VVRIEGHDKEALSQREGGIWEFLSGRRQRAPIGQLLGTSCRYVDPELGILSNEFPANPQFANPFGQTQGGALAMMLDSTIGQTLAITLQQGEIPQTIEMKVSYLRPAKLETLVGEGRVVRKGRSIAFLEGELRNETGEIVAMATATFQIQQRR
jgi:uncharacterized protein (TIGR00369 family)